MKAGPKRDGCGKRILTPERAFILHKLHAQERCIPFKFTYEMWIAWWEEKLGPDWFERRGPWQGYYVMSRYGDIGAYHPDNVDCVIAAQNTGELVTKEQREKLKARMRGNKYRLGIHHSIETRTKMSAAGRGRKKSDAWIAARKARKMTNEQKARLGASLKVSPAALAQRAILHAQSRGKKKSEEQRAAQSVAMIRRFSDPDERVKTSVATRAGMAKPGVREKTLLAQKAAMARPEVRAKISAARKGKKLSDEHRAALSAAQFKRWAKRSHAD